MLTIADGHLVDIGVTDDADEEGGEGPQQRPICLR